MGDFVSSNAGTIILIGCGILLIAICVCIFFKLLRVAIGLLILLIVAPALMTIFWGDGSTYVSKFASLFAPEYQQQIEEAYQYYKDKDAENPVVEAEQAEQAISDMIESLKESIQRADPSDKALTIIEPGVIAPNAVTPASETERN